MKHKFFKIGAAAALTLTGVSVASALKPVTAASYKTPLKRVEVNYLPGKSIQIWTNYQGGQPIGYRAKNNSKWNVAKIAVDKKGNLWYRVGINEWIQARYTIEIKKLAPKKTSDKVIKMPKKAKKQKKVNLSNLANQIKKTVNSKTTKTEVPATKPTNTPNTANNTATLPKAPVSQAASLPASTSAQAAAVVNLAEQQVGKGYGWGANGPDNFDCSSLVQYVYQQAAGISLPRTTYDQVKVGEDVPLDQLQPGDLLFWGSTTAPYHVAIYVGNNQYVNAATPEQGVILQTISSYYYPTCARRVLQ